MSERDSRQPTISDDYTDIDDRDDTIRTGEVPLGAFQPAAEPDDDAFFESGTAHVDDTSSESEFDQNLLGLAVFDPPTQQLRPTHLQSDSGKLVAGRYLIESRIGEGGMGEVFLVRHRHLARHFALKVIQPELSQSGLYREMFHREAQLASLLQHPNIVSVVDFGEDPDHGLFMVMEHLEGETLSARLRERGRLPVKVVCDVMAQLADALICSHSRRVVHADIKPDNVLCLRSGGRSREWEVKLVDFGMANLWSAETKRRSAVGGAPAFMAPERIDGQTPHPSMDIYGLGVLMYLMITGTVPFHGITPEEVFEAHRSKAPAAMSDVLGERLPDRLEMLVDRALAKNPADRQPDITTFSRELRDLMQLQGLKERRKEVAKSSRLVAGLGVARRDRAAAAAYDQLPFPAGSVLADGTLCLANRALAFFLTGSGGEPAEGINLMHTRLPLHYPGLSDAIEAALGRRVTTRAMIHLERPSGPSRLQVIVRPARDTPGACSLIIVPIEAPNRPAAT